MISSSEEEELAARRKLAAVEEKIQRLRSQLQEAEARAAKRTN